MAQEVVLTYTLSNLHILPEVIAEKLQDILLDGAFVDALNRRDLEACAASNAKQIKECEELVELMRKDLGVDVLHKNISSRLSTELLRKKSKT